MGENLNTNKWSSNTHSLLNINAGICVWDAKLLLSECGFDYVSKRDSLVVVPHSLSDEELANVGEKIISLREITNAKFEVMLIIDEPRFARRLKENVLSKINSLGLKQVEVLMMRVNDVAGLKAGSLMQILGELKAEGVIGEVGLHADDPRWSEWLAINTGVRAIGVTYDLENQDVTYRSLSKISDYGMLAFGFSNANSVEDMAFRLAKSGECLPIVSQIPADGLPEMMPETDVERVWAKYTDKNDEPESLPRGLPPN